MGSRNGAGSGADSVGSRGRAGSGADSVGSRGGAYKPPLMGRNWLQEIFFNWKESFSMRHTAPVNPSTISDVLDKHKKLFGDGYGKIT